MKERILLACSGTLDSSVAIRSLTAAYHADVVTLTLDVGQGDELEKARERCLAAGAIRAHVLDVRDEFARECLLPALQAGTLQGTGAAMLAELARPLVARKLLEIAAIEQAGSIALAPELESVVRAMDPDIRLVALSSDAGRVAEAASHASRAKAAAEASGIPAHVEILFEQGMPTEVNGVAMGLVELIESLSTIAGGQGAVVLQAAYKALATFQGTVTGVIRMKLFKGTIEMLNADFAMTNDHIQHSTFGIQPS